MDSFVGGVMVSQSRKELHHKEHSTMLSPKAASVMKYRALHGHFWQVTVRKRPTVAQLQAIPVNHSGLVDTPQIFRPSFRVPNEP